MPSAPHDVIATCPVCTGELAVTRLHCAECGTTLEGRFGVGRFGRLDKDQLVVLESFLRSRGNLRDMERELGISYPTVRNRVEARCRVSWTVSAGTHTARSGGATKVAPSAATAMEPDDTASSCARSWLCSGTPPPRRRSET